MPGTQKARPKIQLGPSFEISYLTPKEMSRRSAGRWVRRLLLRILILVAIVILFALLFRSNQRAKLQKEEVRQFQALAAESQGGLEKAEQNGDVGQFAPVALKQWQSVVKRTNQQLEILQKSPDNSAERILFKADLKDAAAACGAATEALKHALIVKSHERCPRHPGIPRDPEYKVCPYPPEYHYAFDVWIHQDNYCWRSQTSTVCKRLQEIHLCG